jgi:hypothetical protein
MMTHLPSMKIHEMDLISLSEIGIWAFLIWDTDVKPKLWHHSTVFSSGFIIFLESTALFIQRFLENACHTS